jgi:DNA-binding transcriptional MerR regulator
MFKIGDFSRVTQVTVKALRHYDDLGLLKPARVDPDTGYRYYAAAQVPRLHRILALKDLGLSLEQIGPFLDAELSTTQLQALLLVKQSEVAEQIARQEAQLGRIAARLHQLEQPATQAAYDVVVKRVEAQAVAAIRATLPRHEAVSELFRELSGYRQRHGLTATAWTAIWHDPEHRETAVDAEATFASLDPLPADGHTG